MDKKWHFDIGYLLFALIVVMLLQQLWSAYQEADVVPYSQFSTMLRDGKISDVEVAEQYMRATLKEPLPDGRKQVIAVRVDPAIAKELETANVKFSGVVELVAQCADPIEIMDAEQVVRLMESRTLRSQTCANVTLQPAIHQHAAPPIGARIGERAERVPWRNRILRPFEEADAGVELHASEFGRSQRSRVGLEFEPFAGTCLSTVQKTEFQGSGQAAPVRVDGEGRHFLVGPSCRLPTGFSNAARSAAVVPRLSSGTARSDAVVAVPSARVAGETRARARLSGVRDAAAAAGGMACFARRGVARRAS